ncbi:MAG: ATP-binding protein [Lachnospiraceae bacterium]|nr:ATP-binding protein [Lachnospiraceae bacterium]
MFVGRAKETAALNSFYEKAKERVACIYGRTGIGKTTLLKEFAKDKKTIYFTAYATTDEAELAIFADAIGVDLPLYTLEILLDEVSKIGSREPVLLVIDHYPNFVKADPKYDEILYEYVTNKWLRMPIKVILCGDSYLAMEKKVFGKKGRWKDVLSLAMEVSPMDFYDARQFFPTAKEEEALMFYGMTGGIPYALTKLDGDVESSMMRLFLKEEDDATLLPERTLSLELRELSYYNRMLATLAEGHTRVNAISAAVGKPKDIVVPYMNTLISIGVVKKENPVTEKTNRKKTQYKIISSYDRFWYKYVAPNMGLYYRGEFGRIIEEKIRPNLADFKHQVFVDMCREYLMRSNGKEKLPFEIHEIGNWWENDEEKHTTSSFDLVALGENEGKSVIIFSRCYYTRTPVGIATLKELIELTKHAKSKGEGDVYYLVFSNCGFHENTQTVAATIKNIMLISLKEICRE